MQSDFQREKSVNEFAPEQIDEIREAFSLFDTDGDGLVSIRDTELMLRTCGQKTSPEDVRVILEELCCDIDGTVDFAEFLTLVARLHSSEYENEIREAVGLFDWTNQMLTPAELRSVLSNICPELTAEEMDEITQEVVDDDGLIRFEKFAQSVLRI